jgi:hypothetical protein
MSPLRSVDTGYPNIHTRRYDRCNTLAEWPHHRVRVVLNSVPEGESNGPKDTQANRIRKLRACCRTGCDLANASAIQNPVSQHGRA